MSSHYGMLLLFPIDRQYHYVIEKYFKILYKKQIDITLQQFQQLFRIDKNHLYNVIHNRSNENIADGKLIFYIFQAKSVIDVNEGIKKLARREIDNIRFQKTGIDRKTLPYQNHLHTTDNNQQLMKSLRKIRYTSLKMLEGLLLLIIYLLTFQ